MTEEDQGERTTTDILNRLREDSILGDFTIPLKVSAGSDDLARSFDEVCRLLGSATDAFTLTFRVDDASNERTWSLEAGPDGCRVTDHQESAPDLEIFVDSQTCKQLLSGSIVPLEAFGRGRMRVRGDVRLARRIVRRLHAGTSGQPKGR